MDTQKRSKIYTKNLGKSLLLFFMVIVSSGARASDGVMPIDKTDISLPGGRLVMAQRAGVHSHFLILKKGKNVIWKKRYEEEYDRLWDYAFFVPVRKGHYNYDVDKDGFPEIGVATWDGGNNIADRDALVFSVTENGLKYFDTVKFNLEYGENIY